MFADRHVGRQAQALRRFGHLCSTYQLRRLSHYRVVEHITRCQHTRDRPAGAARGRDNDLRLHVKQYIPKSNPSPKPHDVTIIAAHANGFVKEVNEPMWDDLYESLRERGRGIRSIWIADIGNQGQSGVLNEGLLGPDASWWDHSRDLLYLINQFQDEIPKPIFGIGHSVGGSHLAYLSLLHPRLFEGLVLVDPIMQRDLSPHKAFAKLSTGRRDIWRSRKAAAEKFRNSKFYQAWDARVLDKWIGYGLRDLPTEMYPDLPEDFDPANPPVTLSTTKAQEVYYYLRAYYKDKRLLQDDDIYLRDIHPDDQDHELHLARPESAELYRRLPEISPSVLYVFGKNSEASPPEYRLDKVSRTGTGLGGSGGAEKGKVEEAVLDCGHLVGMEKPTECAEASAAFIDAELKKWEIRERQNDAIWKELGREDQVGINAEWRQHVGVEEK